MSYFATIFLRGCIGALDLEMIENILKIGFKNEDFFIQACSHILKLREMQEKEFPYKTDFDSLQKNILVKMQDVFLRKYLFENKSSCISIDYQFNEEIKNGLFGESAKKSLEQII